MKRSRVDYRLLVAQAASDPAAAFQAALEADDPVGLALVSVVQSGTAPAMKAAWFNAVVSHYGATAAMSELFLGVIEGADQLPTELTEAATSALQEKSRELPMDGEQIARAKAIVGNRAADDVQRMRVLGWLWLRDRKAAREAATALLTDPDEPHQHVTRQAVLVMGAEGDSDARTLVKEYAERHLEAGQAEPPGQPDAALYVVNAIARPTSADVPMIGEILTGAAAAGVAVGDSLKSFARRITMEQLAAVVQHLQEEGHSAWLAGQLVPALIRERPADLAAGAGGEWWPTECRAVFASTNWEQYDDDLYPVVLKRLHETGDEAACTEIRQRVAQRCADTSSSARSGMPRAGVRALVKLTLRGEIPPTDPSLMTALRAVDSSLVETELASASWKSPVRARRLGQTVAELGSDMLVEMVARSLDDPPGTTLALVEGAGASVDSEIERILALTGDDEAVLTGLCELSEEAAGRTLERWLIDHCMVAFRALESTERAEDRLSAVPAAVRKYRSINEADRAELLTAFGHRDERVEGLCSILGDWSQAGEKPSDQDLLHALNLLGEHLADGLDPDRVLDTVGVICREVRTVAVRRAAYEALGKAEPTAAVVDLLQSREEGEAASVRSVAKSALQQMADKLDCLAGDGGSGRRAEAAELLARIDVPRAVRHARELLTALEAKDRMLAAGILAGGGSQEDAERLEAASLDEPSPEAREEFMRAVRRLRIGDSAAAHERLGELAGVRDRASWEVLDPKTIYGRWVDAIVTGLDRVARAESGGDFGTAIDQLDEIAKVLLFRAIELAGEEVTSPANQAKAAANELAYGNVLGWQQLNQKWSWAHNFGGLHGLRTEHIALRGTPTPPPERDAEDLRTARAFFKLGGGPCCDLIKDRVSGPKSSG